MRERNLQGRQRGVGTVYCEKRYLEDIVASRAGVAVIREVEAAVAAVCVWEDL